MVGLDTAAILIIMFMGLGDAEILLLTTLVFFIFSIRKIMSKKKNIVNQEMPRKFDTEKTQETTLMIPDSCPHCKNPNTKKIRLCEWCGNQIV
jgi:hypothetical protein